MPQRDRVHNVYFKETLNFSAVQVIQPWVSTEFVLASLVTKLTSIFVTLGNKSFINMGETFAKNHERLAGPVAFETY